MRRSVNGVPVELETDGAEVTPIGDRLAVRSDSGTHSAVSIRVGDAVHVSYRGQVYVVERLGRTKSHARGAHSGELHAPMPGAIVAVLVEVGQQVARGDKLVVLEAMKTQQSFVAPFDGEVARVSVSVGAQVTEGEELVVVRPDEDTS